MRDPAPAVRRESGVFLYILLIFVILSVALTVSLGGNFTALVRDRPRERAALAAVYAAQGGIERARAALARDPAFGGDRPDSVAVGRGSAEVTVGRVPGEPELREIVSIGSIPGPGVDGIAARTGIVARVRLGPALPRVLSWREGR